MERVIKQLCLTMNSLRSPRDDAGASAESVQGTRALCELVAASRNLRFGAKPSSAVAVSRRRNMNCYSHSSMDFQTRRETFRVYFCARADVISGGTKERGCRITVCLLP